MVSSERRRVAVLGAGASGVFSAAHLIASGIEVEVFERNAAPGGIWLYDERPALPPPFPSMKPSEADRPWLGSEDEEEIALRRAPPGPCYENLRTNVPTQLMAVTLLDVPLSTPEYVPHGQVLDYIQEISSKYGVQDATTFGAQVEKVKKVDERWVVTWTMAPRRNEDGNLVEMERHSTLEYICSSTLTKDFDAVVVATGHYHAPRVPDMPGLSATAKRYPSRVMHSKQKGTNNLASKQKKEAEADVGKLEKTVLILGGGVSSVDIAEDMSVARHIYQSTRNSSFDLDQRMLPKNASRVDQVISLQISKTHRTLRDNEPLPILAKMSNGETLGGIDFILMCTGYHISLPFLQDYHNDDLPLEEADERILVTEGTQVHNLHKDIFYISDPTLAFVGLPYYTFTHSVFDFQAITVALVFSGVVDLPDQAEMRAEYEDKVKEVGLGKTFHSLLGKEEVYVKDLVSWINQGRASRNLKPIPGFSANWYAAKEALRQKYREQSQTGDFS
ncbi:hypothetical protein LLEC1_06516 [Akanthomyces lecanii]|uniref:FAD/NAD(P)-binding domain-containing protein n=1 Tax=Cordyceps confragosa TaxID=2714763 RepID=A0A179IBY6_CORDF|nr:hypothetical protein LLEC1_06516 [Akanthomyces lecanii]